MKFYQPSEYQSKANAVFEQVSRQLFSVLPEAKIEHVGSSAIAGAISKGDLDIFVGVVKQEFSKALTAIEKLGFQIKQETLRTESLCMLETSEYDMDVAIQLVELGSQFENFLVFRDRLNADPALIESYNSLKSESTGLSSEEYREKKSEFIRKVLSL